MRASLDKEDTEPTQQQKEVASRIVDGFSADKPRKIATEGKNPRKRKQWVPRTEYGEKLRDPRWQRKRLEIMQRDNFACCVCCGEGETLAVHHKNYERGKEPWEYPNENFVTLCETCHEMVGGIKKSIMDLADFGPRCDAFNDLIFLLRDDQWLDVVKLLSKLRSARQMEIERENGRNQ